MRGIELSLLGHVGTYVIPAEAFGTEGDVLVRTGNSHPSVGLKPEASLIEKEVRDELGFIFQTVSLGFLKSRKIIRVLGLGDESDSE